MQLWCLKLLLQPTFLIFLTLPLTSYLTFQQERFTRLSVRDGRNQTAASIYLDETDLLSRRELWETRWILESSTDWKPKRSPTLSPMSWDDHLHSPPALFLKEPSMKNCVILFRNGLNINSSYSQETLLSILNHVFCFRVGQRLLALSMGNGNAYLFSTCAYFFWRLFTVPWLFIYRRTLRS